MKKSIVWTTLLLSSLFLLFTACTSPDPPDESKTNTDTTAAVPESAALPQEQSTATPEETARPPSFDYEKDLAAVIAALPEADFDGFTFHSWCANRVNELLLIQQAPQQDMTGEPVNDALWKRDRAMEDKYHVRLTYTHPEESHLNLYADASKLILSGDTSISLLYGDLNSEAPVFLQNGLLLDVKTLPYIDLSQPHWSRHNADMALAGKNMLVTGDLTTRYAGAPYILLFNKQLFDERHFAYPYEDVRNGTWTFDKMETLVQGQAQDLDGGGTMDIDDFYGFAYEYRQAYAFFNGFGYASIRLENETEAVIACTGEAELRALQRLTDFAQGPDIRISNATYEETTIFEEDRAIFCGQTACNLYLLTEMESDFGVLPSPKENETQDAYYSYINDNCAVATMIPKTIADPACVGCLVEALAAASRVSSMRAQYEGTLLYRQTRDRDSVAMLRLATEASVYDLGVVYKWGDIFNTLNHCINADQPIASKMKSLQKLVPKTAETVIRKVLKAAE